MRYGKSNNKPGWMNEHVIRPMTRKEKHSTELYNQFLQEQKSSDYSTDYLLRKYKKRGLRIGLVRKEFIDDLET